METERSLSISQQLVTNPCTEPNKPIALSPTMSLSCMLQCIFLSHKSSVFQVVSSFRFSDPLLEYISLRPTSSTFPGYFDLIVTDLIILTIPFGQFLCSLSCCHVFLVRCKYSRYCIVVTHFGPRNNKLRNRLDFMNIDFSFPRPLRVWFYA